MSRTTDKRGWLVSSESAAMTPHDHEEFYEDRDDEADEGSRP